MARNHELTPTLVTYAKIILKMTQQDESVYFNQSGKAEEALYSKAIVYDQKVNILIDSGAV